MKAVVTGSTRGIGKAICDLLADKGFDLAICARTKEDLSTQKEELQKTNPEIEVLPVATDLAKKQEVMNFAEKIKDSWDSIDVLVNNGGVFIPGSLAEEEEGIFEKTLHTNLFSVYYLTRVLLGMVKKGKPGHIMNMCSTASIKAYPNGGSYCISKFGLLGFTKTLREEMKEEGVRVTAILPGPTFTASWKGVDVPEERFMKPEDVALSLWNAYELSQRTNVEEIVLRPQEGDL